MDGEIYDERSGCSWYRIEIPVMQKCWFAAFINKLDKCYFWMENINNATMKYYGLAFAPNGLKDTLINLDFLEVGELFSIHEISDRDDHYITYRCLLIESVYNNAGFLLWNKIGNTIHNLTVTAFMIEGNELGNDFFVINDD
jgi:hypothetical protein